MTLILLRPWWLLALVPLVALAALAWRRRAAGGWEAIVAPELIAFLRARGDVGAPGRRWPALLPFALAGLVALALSGPARLRTHGAAFERQDPLVLMIDLSPSVTEGGDLADAQAAAAWLLAHGGGRPIGILLYAADAFLASAPTSDPATLQSLVAVLDARTMPVGGSRPDIALSEAAKLFAAPGMPGAGGTDVVMISDGGGASPEAERRAGVLAERGARVWGLTLDRGAADPDAPPPDPGGLAAIARAGGGAAWPARDPAPLVAAIAAARTRQLAREAEAPEVFEDLGRWLLLLALPLALAFFRPTREPGR
ncbi:VWA domain-containing protein [Amaricoccus solimangrovi]|uniref:VWA domain-containing protein n=1 Tax=Amaricoccus solimangrovi TaxID=2589815 RepID=A0A501WPI0_9RHOB|nr:VWA domain-containing protein [Amaricoccus solimangrovi]TPE50235.1 VWA domain-containing protein [Amaricoccus solimangrovi]